MLTIITMAAGAKWMSYSNRSPHLRLSALGRPATTSEISPMSPIRTAVSEARVIAV